MSSSKTTTTSEETLTKEQRKQFDKERANYFKGSIAAMVIYGTVILLFALIGIFSESGRYFLFEQNFGFTVTFIGGVILVITLMLIQLLTYKPSTRKITEFDELTCPDYWELKKVTPEMKQLLNEKWHPWTNYYCQAPSNVNNLNTNTLFTTEDTTPVEKEYTKMLNEFNRIRGLAANQPVDNKVAITCSRLYPEYMNLRDLDSFPDKPNSLRCNYLKNCGVNNVTWTGVCPNPK